MHKDKLIQIQPEDLCCLNDYENKYPIRIDLVYAKPEHKDNMFKEAIYKSDAKMWVHKQLLPIILRASEICYEDYKYIFELKDCLRTSDAQAKITDTAIVKAHPHWTADGPHRLFSGPGKGGHPRGMAVDVILIDETTNAEIDMGTSFDYLTEDTNPDNNPAARSYNKFPAEILQNRMILENAMMTAAKETNIFLKPLAVEWWDFRFHNEYMNKYAPLSDADLPAEMRMVK